MNETFKQLLERESKFQIESSTKATYYVTVQLDEMKSSWRSVLIDWLIEVVDDIQGVNECVLYAAINYLDRFLSRYKVKEPGKNLQLVGVTCLAIALKMFQTRNTPSHFDGSLIARLCFLTDESYVIRDIHGMEQTILSCLKFNMSCVTCYDFLMSLFHNHKEILTLDEKDQHVAKLVMQVFSLSNDYLKYRPHQIAVSAIDLALQLNCKRCFDFIKFGIEKQREEIRLCFSDMRTAFQVVFATNVSILLKQETMSTRIEAATLTVPPVQTIYNKFSKEPYNLDLKKMLVFCN